uniref:Uncharacterized protein n=1 Tax=Arundo donax TaxID=35708 RepID=A0A0A9GMH6_ARUDO
MSPHTIMPLDRNGNGNLFLHEAQGVSITLMSKRIARGGLIKLRGQAVKDRRPH